MYVDAQWFVICTLLWIAFSFMVGFRFAGWYYRRYPERNRSTEQTLRNVWKAVKTWLHKWGEPEKVS